MSGLLGNGAHARGILWLGLLLVSLSFPASAEPPSKAASPERITVAYSIDSIPFHFTGDNGQPAGMIIDQWRLWSKKSGIEVEFLPATWDETLRMVGDGRADVHAGLFHNAERDAYLDYGAPLTRTDTHVFLHKALPPIARLEDLAAYRVGVLAGDYVEGYLRERLPASAVVGYADYDAIMAALDQGRIRAFAADTPTGIFHLQRYGLAGDYSYPQNQHLYDNDWYAAVREGNGELLAVVNRGLARISEEERRDIQRRWASGRGEGEGEALIIAMARDYPPFTFLNAQAEPAGLLVDLWRLWSRTTGRAVRFQVSGWSDTLERLRAGESDLHSGLFPSPARERWLDFSRPLYEVSSSLYRPLADAAGGDGGLESLSGRVGVVAGSFQEEFLREHHPALELFPLASEERLIRAAREGRIHAFLAEDPAVDALLSSLGMRGEIARVGEPLLRNGVVAAVPKGGQGDRLRLIDEGLQALPMEELLAIERRWIPDAAQRYFESRRKVVALSAEERAWLQAHPRARVGAEKDWPPFDFVADGRSQGYSIELLKLAAERTGLELELVIGESWAEIMGDFRRGELELLPAVVETAERTPFMAFSQSYLTLPNVLVIREGERQVERMTDLAGRTLAVIDGFYYVGFIEQAYPDTRLLKVAGALQGLEAVLYGQADAFVGSQVVLDRTLKQHALGGVRMVSASELDEREPLELRFGVHREQPLLAAILDKGLAAITEEERTALHRRWIGETATVEEGRGAEPKLALSTAERAWLAEHPEIRLGVDPDWAPFEFFDGERRYRGLCADYVRLINERLGLSMAPPAAERWSEVMRKAEVREIDVFPCLARTPRREGFLNFAESHISFPWMIITRKGAPLIGGIQDLLGGRVAVVGDYVTHERLSSELPELELLVVESSADGLEAVSVGRADAFVGNLAVISNIIERRNLTNLKVAAPLTGGQDSLHFAVRSDWPELVPILEKALRSITPEEHTALRQRWSALAYEGIDLAQVRRVALQVGGVAALLFIVILFWNRRLQREVGQRREVERQLAHARDMAENANRAKSEFLANMSHEIRTPMNAIIGLSSLALRTELTPKQRDYLEKIDLSSHGLLGIINDILDFSKIEAGKLEMESISFSLAEVLQRLADLVRPSAAEKGLELRFTSDPMIPEPLLGDPLRLGQVLTNLVNNAVKFTERGEVLLDAVLVERRDDRVRLRVTVHDSGIGMSEEQVARLFHSFTQADGSTTRKYGGTGLGLAISRRLVEMMGGEIEVTSRPGEGSAFTIELTLACADDAVAGEGGVVESRGQSPWQPRAMPEPARLAGLRGARVLLAEDNPINQQVAREVLEQVGIDVVIAGDGIAALRAAREERFDAVLMDVQMPGMDGYEATRAIRLLPEGERLPIIAMTAHAMAGDRERCLAYGMNDHVPKPTEPANLYEALLRWIEPRGEGGEPVDDTPLGPSPGAAVDASVPPLPDELPGIDTEVGLRRVGGNRKLQRKLLLTFRDDYGEAAIRYHEALERETLEPARQLVHSLKGAAGNLGAEELFHAALDLERSLKRGALDTAAEGRFLATLAAVLEGLQALEEEIPAQGGASTAVEIDDERVATLLTELGRLLGQGNARAGVRLEELSELLGEPPPEPFAEPLARLRRHLDDYEFEEAAATLAELLESMEGR